MNEQVEKVVRDGKVAVIVSPGFGAGWSTWADDAEAAVFAPDVVAWIESGKRGSTIAFERYGYTGGLDDAEIEWLPVGTRFIVDEYDGAEALAVLGPEFGFTA